MGQETEGAECRCVLSTGGGAAQGPRQEDLLLRRQERRKSFQMRAEDGV